MKISAVCILPLALALAACSPTPEPADKPAWPDLQDEPPALVEIAPEPMLAKLQTAGLKIQ